MTRLVDLLVRAAPIIALVTVSSSLSRTSAIEQQPPSAAPVTFSKDVAPILFKHCVECHRPGEVAPMSLLTYKDARPWARSIREQVLEGTMPPWFADPAYGHFVNERRLTRDEIDTIASWVTSGAREGNRQDLPKPPEFIEGWRIGQPDAVLEMAEEYNVPATGVIDYQHFTVPTDFAEDKWVQAAEVRPGDRAHVHHIVVHFREPGRPASGGLKAQTGQDLDLIEADLGPALVVYAPGMEPTIYPRAAARRLKAGTRLTFQVHYTTDGTPGRDRTRVGLVFATDPPGHEIRSLTVFNSDFKIPAGHPNYRIEANATFTEGGLLWRLFPHAHLRGKSFRYRLTYPDKRSEIVLSVPKFDFNWQPMYTFAEPIRVPANTRLQIVAYYDNSRDNPWNPDPTAEVRWGVQTWQEMLYSSVEYSVDRQPGQSPD